MPFHNFASKLVLMLGLLLVHSALIARCAPPKPIPSATAAAAELVDPSAPNSATTKSPGSDLLDETKLPFLSVCKGDIKSETLCHLYRSLATTQLIPRKSGPVTIAELQNVIAEQVDPNSFCDDFIPVLKEQKTKHPEIVTGSLPDTGASCPFWCIMLNQKAEPANVKAVCKVLLWGYRQELAQEAAPQDPIEKVASEVIVPPLLDQNVRLAEVEKKEVVEIKPAAAPVAPQPNITESAKAAAQPPTAPKVSPAEDDKQPSIPDTAAAAAIQPPSEAVAGGVEAAQVTPSKAVSTVSDSQKDTGDEKTSQEQENANNIQNENNIESDAGNQADDGVDNGEDADEDYLGGDQSDAPQQSFQNEVQQPAQGLPHDTDSDSLGVDQPAAAAEVKIEKVDPFFDQDDSNFFSYFVFMMFACIACYVAYHNKSKLLALVVEGRRSSTGRGGFSKGGRKHTAAYRKLDCNLEEAISSNASSNSRSTSQFIY